MSTPLVSIIIPCYNAETWVAECIRSAVDQSWVNTEVIVVDDGSTDKSLSVARTFESPRVKVVTQANRGASAARNAGLALAQGSEVQFLDADDVLHRHKIRKQIEVRQTCDPLALLSGEWDHFRQSTSEALFQTKPNWRNMTGVEFLQIFYETFAMMQPAAWLSPRALIDRCGPWNESLTLNDDGEYFARVMLASPGIIFCEGARVYYRTHGGASLSRRKDRRSMESLFRSVDLMLRYLLEFDQSERTKAAAAFAWKWTGFETYPGAPDLSKECMRRSQQLGGSERPFPAGGRFQLAAKILGWRLAKRLTV